MNKNKNIPVEEKSFVYPANEENLKKFNNHKLKLISDDKKYLLIYNENEFNEIVDYHEWLFEQDLFAKSSPSDLEYETLLVDVHIKKTYNHELYATSFVKLDEKIEKFIYFNDSKMAISTVVCSLKELSSGIAIPKFVMVASSVANHGKSIKEVIPDGYITFKLRGSKNEK
jgi:hypothetical protein